MSNAKHDAFNVTAEAQHAGREAIVAWARDIQQNYFARDAHFRRILGLYARPERLGALEQELTRFGEEAATALDQAVRLNNEPQNLPRLRRYSDHGERTEGIEHHPSYHEAGRYIYGSGIMEAYGEHPNTMGVLARFYVSSFNGEAGHNCPLACTAGVIRVLQELGTPELQAQFLPGLLDRRYEQHLEGAQFLTEIQGGSDVGANATWAEEQPDGSWRIYGEKWFCSNIDADVFLMTARPRGAAEGTRGLGLFLVPRKLEDGTINAFHVRRLKEKLGTRSMASGEVDFRGAVAHHMGSREESFKNMMALVINTSRLFNAVGCCGISRQAYVIAQGYARHRQAFGQPILAFALVQETLADVRAEVDAMTSGTMHLVALQDALDAGRATGALEQGFMRMALNLNKMRTAKSARWVCVQGIELLGGNGAIESFSVMPRLLRDTIVYENWEGTHNTLMNQVFRDMQKYRIHEGYLGYLEGLLREACQGPEGARALELEGHLARMREQLLGLLSGTGEQATSLALLGLRTLLDELSWLMYAVVRLHERARLLAQGLLAPDDGDEASLEHFLDLRLRPAPKARDAAYLARIAQVAALP